MRSPNTLHKWIQKLLPEATPVAHQAAAALVRALMMNYTTNLSQLARQLDRCGRAKGARQWLHRWLNREGFAPETLYAYLLQLVPHAVWDQREILLLVDTTFLADRWVVLQVSIPWQRRALPLWRVAYPYSGSERDQATALAQALRGLREHLPGPRALYVLVLDRGFAGMELISALQRDRWRFVLRVRKNWRMEHPEYSGLLQDAVRQGLVGATPRVFRRVKLGFRYSGRDRRKEANVVWFYGEGHAEPWFLVTSDPDAAAAVAIYRRRMQIEQEFRDVKGSFGLDSLAAWTDLQRVARFLAWLAVYEWRLAFLWVEHRLEEYQEQLRVTGGVSWLRTAREWLIQGIRLAKPHPDLRL